MADTNEQAQILKHLLAITARIEGKTDVIMMELAKYKAKANGTTELKELEELEKSARDLGRSIIERVAGML
jgi:hypothetical protein